MRILLRARPWLLSNRQAQAIRTNSSSFRPLTTVDDFAESLRKWYSIFASKSVSKLPLNRIHHRNIAITSVKSKQVQNVAKRTDLDGDYIYNGKSTSTIKRLKLYSFALSIGGIYSQPFLWGESKLFGDTGLAIEDSFCIPMAFAAMLSILIHFKMKNYVTDIRYNKETDEYTCSTISFFLLKNSKIKFKVEDIRQTENSTSGIVIQIGPKNIQLLLEPGSFTESEHYSRILGYDTRTKETISDGESIYSSPHSRSISQSKLFSYTIFFCGMMAQYGLWQMWGVWGCSVGGALAIVWPTLTHFRVKNIVLDIRYKKETDEYTCTTNSIFSLEKKLKFKMKDIHNLDAQTVFTSLQVGPKKVPLFIEKGNFTDSTHYARLMGYDKQFDLGMVVAELEDVKRRSIDAGDHQKSEESNATDAELERKKPRA